MFFSLPRYNTRKKTRSQERHYFLSVSQAEQIFISIKYNKRCIFFFLIIYVANRASFCIAIDEYVYAFYGRLIFFSKPVNDRYT